MKIATWNVNSLKVRLPHVLGWLESARPDVLCLQETKLADSDFPYAAIESAGYRAAAYGQRTYNGVAILACSELRDVTPGIPGFDDPQSRVISARVDGLCVVCVYVPNGQETGSDKYRYKLEWLDRLCAWLQGLLAVEPKVIVAGDYNIAPESRDVYDPAAWEGKVLCSGPERAAFQRLLAIGFADAFRLFEQAERSYTWWDYRMMAFRRKMGLRIDHLLVSTPLVPRCVECHIDVAPRRLERPSDHAPVWLNLADDHTGEAGA